ncbi:RidA family protein [Senegalia massiliensis]|uniref:RidA family protein n=1 Tax=Senegalia massiliensis TaxID=1720316 RepID=A0A845QXX1_9CLOT|nr:RidA family protein [Senegalia massiliensis]NBI05988.1 RidA family protein [Senegalia massiliensis]
MVERTVVSTKKAPGAIGPYSQAIKVGEFVFTSGQLPMDPESGELINDIKKATARSLDSVKAILEEAGSSMENIIKTTIFVKDLDDFAAVNEVYGTYFGDEPPARSCVQVAKIPKDAKVEIEAIAKLK